MADNLKGLPPDELIKIIIASNTEKSNLSEENKQLKTQLAALNDKITLLIEQNAVLNENVGKIVASSQSKPPQPQKNVQTTKTIGNNKRITDSFPVIDFKRAKLSEVPNDITSNCQNATNVNSESNDLASNSSSHMDITENDTPIISKESDWLFVDYKGQKNAQNKKIPPVQVDVSFDGRQSLFSLLQRTIGVNKYTINQLKTKKSVRVHPANENVAASLTEVLKNHGYKFHSYLGTDKKKQCFILRGLNGVDAPDVVQNHLVRAGLPASITVLRHTTGFQRANPAKNHNTLYKVIIDGNTNSDTLRNIQSIFGIAIR